MHYFGAQIPDFPAKFQKCFMVIVLLLSHSFSNRCIFSKNMIRRAPMGNTRRPSNYGSRGPETGAFIQCANGLEPQIHELWCCSIDGICREVHLTARVDIPAGTVRYFVTEYLSENRWRNQIISKLLINGSVQFFGLSQIWGSGLPYIFNIWAHVEATGWGSSSNGNPGSGTPGSITVTVRWGGRFAHSTFNWILNWDGSVNASPVDFPRSPVSPCVARRCVCKDLIRLRHQQRLWSQSNCQDHRRRQDIESSNVTETQ